MPRVGTLSLQSKHILGPPWGCLCQVVWEVCCGFLEGMPEMFARVWLGFRFIESSWGVGVEPQALNPNNPKP